MHAWHSASCKSGQERTRVDDREYTRADSDSRAEGHVWTRERSTRADTDELTRSGHELKHEQSAGKADTRWTRAEVPQLWCRLRCRRVKRRVVPSREEHGQDKGELGRARCSFNTLQSSTPHEARRSHVSKHTGDATGWFDQVSCAKSVMVCYAIARTREVPSLPSNPWAMLQDEFVNVLQLRAHLHMSD